MEVPVIGSVDHRSLAAALRTVGLAATRLADGGTVRIEARGDELVLEASAPDLSVRSVVDLTRPGTGTAVVPARYLERFVSTVDGTIDLDLDGEHLTVRAGRSLVRLRLVDAPWHAAKIPDVTMVPLSEHDRRAMAKVAHAAGAASYAPVLSAIRIGGGSVVASDGYRLSRAAVDPALPDCLPPAELVRRVLSDAGTELDLGADDRSVVLRSPTANWSTPSVEGEYFAWERAIPSATETTESFEAGTLALLDATRRVEKLGFRTGATAFAKVVLERGPAGLVVRANDGEVGEVVDEIEGSSTLPAIAFNATYLREALEQLDVPVVRARCAAPTKAVVMEDETSLQLVMPVRS